LSLADLQARLAEVLVRVAADHAPGLVTRPEVEAVVLVSLADWMAIAAMAHLTASPVNAARLRVALDAWRRAGPPGAPCYRPDAVAVFYG
jgi:prevent-host-death family protein